MKIYTDQNWQVESTTKNLNLFSTINVHSKCVRTRDRTNPIIRLSAARGKQFVHPLIGSRDRRFNSARYQVMWRCDVAELVWVWRIIFHLLNLLSKGGVYLSKTLLFLLLRFRADWIDKPSKCVRMESPVLSWKPSFAWSESSILFWYLWASSGQSIVTSPGIKVKIILRRSQSISQFSMHQMHNWTEHFHPWSWTTAFAGHIKDIFLFSF